MNKIVAALVFVAMGLSANAIAQERKAYRVVDAAGNVTYTQTPPVEGKDTKKVDKVDIAPAQRGRGGDTGSYHGYQSYGEPRYHYGQQAQERYAAAAQARTNAQEQRMASLKAECERQRGTDCNNPRALQYLDSTSIPRRSRYH